jgi:hypothetical protein
LLLPRWLPRFLEKAGAPGTRAARMLYLARLKLGERLGLSPVGRQLMSGQFGGYVAITTGIGCKNLCEYCPQETFLAAYARRENRDDSRNNASQKRVLTLEDFKRFIAKIPREYTIHFAGFSEPWLNPRCTDMVLAAHELGYGIRVYTTLAGMTREDVRRMRDIPFLLFDVHLAAAGNRTKIKVDERLLDTLKATQDYRIANMLFHSHIDRPLPDIIEILGAYQIEIEGVNDRAGNIGAAEVVEALAASKKTGRIRCSFNAASTELNHNILLPNGDVLLCCQDWSMAHVLGNLNAQDLASLYDQEPYLTLVRALDDDSLPSLCRRCALAVPAVDA